MKYLKSNKAVIDWVNMQNRDDFGTRTEYNLKMLENLRRTSPKKVKRFRSAFTTDQVNYLEIQFKKFPYIGNAHRKEVAQVLNIPERAVKIWFQNRRMKEKKETGKEFDDETNSRKSLEFPKDQLNNVNLSANEQQSYSLPLLTNVDMTDSHKNKVTNTLSGGSVTELLISNSALDNQITVSSPVSLIKPYNSVSPNNSTKSPKLSKGLYKKYNNNCLKQGSVQTISIKQEEMKHTEEQRQKTFEAMEQMIPEDLSNRKTNVFTNNQGQIQNTTPNNPGYISVVSPFYAQPYYTASGVLWKPVNIVPTVTTPGSSIPLPLSNSVGSIPLNESGIPKKCCNCDCHVKPMMPYNLQQQPSSPQYIITAMQFPNSTATKF